jgi:hypothetical protein
MKYPFGQMGDGMDSRRITVLWAGAVLGMSLNAAVADEFGDLPPPPGDEPGLSIGSDFSDAPFEDLPPVPGLDSPMQSAELDQSLGDGLLPFEDAPSAQGSTSFDEPLPPLTPEPESFSDLGSEALTDFPQEQFDGPVLPPVADLPSERPMSVDASSSMGALNEPSSFSSGRELSDLSMGDRVKTKDLVLWLSFGPSYSKLNTKGDYSLLANGMTGFDKDLGGLGYNISLGFMVNSWLQGQLDFSGTPYTRNTTVDHGMFGFGPRLGFISVMALVGSQRGVDMSSATAFNARQKSRLLSYGLKGGLDLVLSHKKNSRVSYGLAPEVFYITSQQKSGYTNVGAAVSLRIYGYESPF